MRSSQKSPNSKVEYLEPTTELASTSQYSESPEKSSETNFNGYRRLRNKQWVDNLYEKGKQKQQARARSAFITEKEATDLKECTFQPRVNYNHEYKMPEYHSTKKKLVDRLSKMPVKEKARLEKHRREMEKERQ